MDSKSAHPFANFIDTREKLMAVMAPGRPKHCPDLSAATGWIAPGLIGKVANITSKPKHKYKEAYEICR